MSEPGAKLLEYTVVNHRVDKALGLEDARWLRGAVAGLVDRPELHQHDGQGLVYQHPLVRYEVCADEAMIRGLAEGAFLLRGLPCLSELRLGPQEYAVLHRCVESRRVQVGPCSGSTIYHFETPYLALNHENHKTWERGDPFARRRLLERVVIGNLLSLAKAVRLDVAERLHAEVDLQPAGWYELKPGVRLLGFRGAIQVNFTLPERWGIGKSSARGFGTLSQKEV